MNRELNKMLNNIVLKELPLSNKNRTVSHRVLVNFSKIISGRNNEIKQEAITQYNNAKERGTKMSSFTIKNEKMKITNYKTAIDKEVNEMMAIETDYNPTDKKIRGIKTVFHPLYTNIKNTKGNLLDAIFNETKTHHISDLKQYLPIYKEYKINLGMRLKYMKSQINEDVQFDDDEEPESIMKIKEDNQVISIISGARISSIEDIKELEKNYIKLAYDAIERMKQYGSGWSIYGGINCATTFFNVKKRTGRHYIKLDIATQRSGLINIQNDDEQCFKWCLLYHQSNKSKHGERLTVLKKVIDKYDWSNISMPMNVNEIDIFEMQNDKVVINVISLDGNFIRKSTAKGSDIINLILYEKDNESHYIYIKNLSFFFKGFENAKKTVCVKCLRLFTENQLKSHSCGEEGETFTTAITYPRLNEPIYKQDKEGKNIGKPIRHETDTMHLTQNILKKQDDLPFQCFGDLEAFTIWSKDATNIQKHVPNSFGLKLVCNFDSNHTKDIIIYRGPDCIKVLIKTLLDMNDECNKIIVSLRKLHEHHKLTEEEETHFIKQKKCYICDTDCNQLVRDHCHLTGKYRGSACNVCNLNFHHIKKDKKGNDMPPQPHVLPIIFHNLRGYDGHFIIQEAHNYTKNVSSIMQSFEKYMTFSFMNLKFIDSMQFMNSSLENLAENLIIKEELPAGFFGPINHDYSKFINMQDHFKNKTSLLSRKGLYPYEFPQNYNAFEIQTLPAIKSFYSTLTDKTPTAIEYEQALNVFEIMKCETFGDYHDIYLKTDVLLLADIFQEFRKVIKTNYNFELLNYISLPSLSLDAMLKICKQPLGLIYNEEDRLFFDNNKKGGIVQAGGTRHETANNKYMKSYDPTFEASFISYVDMNNLYGGAMSQKMPFKLIGEVDVKLEVILNQPNDAEIGFFVQCDITIPRNLHDKFKEYPLCPVSTIIDTISLSPYQNEVLKNTNAKHNDKSKKLILDLHDKKDYMAHYVYIKKVVELGYIVKVKKVISFKQSFWLRDYISKNTELRTNAKNDFEKDVFKLMSNAIYGKMMENILGRVELKIFTDQETAMKHMNYDNFTGKGDYINEMFFIQCTPKEVEYNKPTYIGNAILDISKVFMIDYHYNYIKPKYGDNSKLIYTDTDSFIYHIKTDDLYQDMFNDKHLFDLSNVKISKFKSTENNKKLYKMKDETGMVPIIEFIATGPKCYSFKMDKFAKYTCQESGVTKESNILETKKTGKGVQRSVLKSKILHEDYLKILKTSSNLTCKQTTIRSQKHQLYTIQFEKICMSAFCDKVYRVNYNEGYPYGYNPTD